MDFKELDKIERELLQGVKEITKLTRKADERQCPDHWLNVIIFGRCWKHDEQGKARLQKVF